MNRYQQQLCENLTVLLSEDYALLNDNEFNELEDYVNSNINEILH